MEQAESFKRTLRDYGMKCPHCSLHSKTHSFTADPEGHRTSFFVCESCHRSTTLDAPMAKFDHRAALADFIRRHEDAVDMA
jgi:protein-arginine kinase activator protein McsA